MNVQSTRKRRLLGLAAAFALAGGLFAAAPSAVQAAPLAPPPVEAIAPEAGVTQVWHHHHRHHHGWHRHRHHHHGWHRRHHHHGWHHHHRRHWGHHHHHRRHHW